MRLRSLILATLGATFVLGAVAPAFADRDDWRREGWRRNEWREHEWREHHRWYPGYYGAPVVVAPPAYYAPPPVYYPPPPVYYAPPAVGLGVIIR